MIDLEVENTLREIRERVRAEAAALSPGVVVAAPALGAGTNGSERVADPALSRLEANLATAERAWSRLPPLVSYRKGAAARLELWLKRQVKRLTHWFTWEQVNFNSAAHHALRDTHAALLALRSEMAALRAELAAYEERLAAQDARLVGSLAAAVRELAEGQRAAVGQLREEQRALVVDLHRDLRVLADDLRREQKTIADDLRREQTSVADDLRREQAAVANDLRREQASVTDDLRREQTAVTDNLRGEQAAIAEGLRSEQAAVADRLRHEHDEHLAALREERQTRALEADERLSHVLEEQRVLFKQLSLEASERAIAHDRARRELETRLEEISKAVMSDKIS